jgi:hypothetical protein
VTEAELLDIRTTCAICGDGRRWRYLGSHVTGRHKMSAREYKTELGIFIKIPLTDPDLEALQKERNAASFDRERFLENGFGTRFLGGPTPHYVSAQFRQSIRDMNKVPVPKVCRKCGADFIGIPAFRKCPACRDTAANARAMSRRRRHGAETPEQPFVDGRSTRWQAA